MRGSCSDFFYLLNDRGVLGCGFEQLDKGLRHCKASQTGAFGKMPSGAQLESDGLASLKSRLDLTQGIRAAVRKKEVKKSSTLLRFLALRLSMPRGLCISP